VVIIEPPTVQLDGGSVQVDDGGSDKLMMEEGYKPLMEEVYWVMK